jgi:predicted nicotinamide N-methyase
MSTEPFKFNFFTTTTTITTNQPEPEPLSSNQTIIITAATSAATSSAISRSQLLPSFQCLDITTSILNNEQPMMSQIKKLQQTSTTINKFKPWTFTATTTPSDSSNNNNTILILYLSSSPTKETELLDVTPGIYEGGYKTWECAVDLTTFLLLNHTPLQQQPTKIIDLGCGTGMCGLAAMKLWPNSQVTFQDLNMDVLTDTTAMNVLFNFQSLQRTQFVTGAWQHIEMMTSHLLQDNKKFDLILTADTLYDSTNYSSMLLLCAGIAAPDAKMYVSAKRLYFGCNGGVDEFISAAKTVLGNKLQHEPRIVNSITEGGLRDIIELIFR